jgi:hypothetical protein
VINSLPHTELIRNFQDIEIREKRQAMAFFHGIDYDELMTIEGN